MASMADIEQIQTWVKLSTEDGTPYYFHPKLNKTQWEQPEHFLDPDAVVEEHEAEVQQKSEYQGDELDSYLGATAVNDDGNQGEDTSDADARTKTTTNKRRSRRSLVQIKSKYSIMKTASYGAGLGDDAGDTYYVNNETGETHWEKPADLLTRNKNAARSYGRR